MAIKFLNTVQVDTDVLYVDTANDRVGIGTTSPGYPLEVSGIIKTSTSFLGTTAIIQKVTALNTNGIQFTNNGGSEKMRITDTGNVGIGTTSPSTKLHVSGGDIRIDDTERIEFGAGGVRINNDAAGRMYYRAPLGFYWETNGGYRMVLNSSGNVGIGDD